MAVDAKWATNLLSTTLEEWLKVAPDQVSKGTPWLSFLESRSAIKKSGGKSLVKPVIFGKSPNAGYFGRGSTLGTSRAEKLSDAEFDWAFHYYQIVMSKIDVWLNSGPQQVIDYVQAEIDIAKREIPEQWTAALLHGSSDRRVAATEGGETIYYPNGLGHIVNDLSGTAVGKITPNSSGVAAEWWKSHRADDRAANYDYDADDGNAFREALEEFVLDTSVNNQYAPDCLLVGKPMYLKISSSAWQKAQYVVTADNTAVDMTPGGMGSQGMGVSGKFMFNTAMVLYDANMDSTDAQRPALAGSDLSGAARGAPVSWKNRIYCLNTNNLFLDVLGHVWMTQDMQMRLPTTVDTYEPIFCVGQLTTNLRRSQGVWDQVATTKS